MRTRSQTPFSKTTMEKKAYYRFAGRDLGTRAALAHLVDEMDKTAEVDEGVVDAAIELSESMDYMDELTKKAYNAGLLAGFQQVRDAIEAEGADIEKIAEQLGDVLDTKTASATLPIAETEEESAEFLSEMVKGAAESLSALIATEEDSDEDILKVAEAVVAEALGLEQE